jgi:uncharacterized protein YecE (DUF72 family)
MELAERGIYIGTCSWTDPTLIEAGTFYPSRDMSAAERLAYYSARFPIVEVDATYYSPPSERVAGLWVERTPPGFVFDVKAFRLLTFHPTPPRSLWKDVRERIDPGKNVYLDHLPSDLRSEALDRFWSALGPLYSAGKLGVILFQFPPWVVPSRRVYRYLEWLRERLPEADLAVEFRNRRWMDRPETVFSFLSEHQFVYVCVDEPQGFESSVPPVAEATWRIAEVRFHGRNAENWERKGIGPAERFRWDYSTEELAEWIPRIRRLTEKAERVHLLMNNCYADYGIRSARLLADLLASAL